VPFASGPILSYVGRGRFITVGQTDYVGAAEVIHVPSDFTTDLATIPRVFWALLPPNGVYENSAVVHDWHCTRLAAGDCDISSRDADGLFRRMAREGGAGFVTRWLLWWGVRLGALANPARRPGIARDLPLMAAIAVPVAATAYGAWWLLATAYNALPWT
jgi:hypothetical protein